jgi:hypothetical protein
MGVVSGIDEKEKVVVHHHRRRHHHRHRSRYHSAIRTSLKTLSSGCVAAPNEFMHMPAKAKLVAVIINRGAG